MKPIARNSMVAILLCSLAIVLVGRSTAVAADGSIPVAENPASDNALLKYLPKDYWLVSSIDLQTVMKVLGSDAVKNNPQSAQLEQVLQTVKLMTGIDFENDVDSLVTFLAGNPEDKKWLTALHGSFDNDSVETTLAGSIFTRSYEKSTYKTKTIYVGADAAFYFPAASTLVAGVPDQVRATIDKLEAEADPELPEALEKLLERTSGDSIVWAATKAGPLLNSDVAADWRADNAELTAELAKIETVSLAFGLDTGGLMIHGLSYLGADSKAKSLYAFLDKRRDSLLKVEGTNVLFCSLLIMSDLTTEGPFTRGSLRLTLPALMELWNSKVIVKPE